jgi:ubiquinone/menaquinone biosynthesis C-methylase UbiE
MERAAGAHELLDGHLDDPMVLRDNLRDLARANAWTGGVALSRRALAALGPLASVGSVLDVGTGAADIPLAFLDDARRDRRDLAVTAVDSRAEVIEAARALRPDLDQVPGLTLDVADGRSLPYADRAFDLAHASLVLHHHDPDEAVLFLRELARVSRLGVVINDLGRLPSTWAGAWLLSHLFTRNPFSRHDAPLSARRAYTPDEATALMLRAGLRPVLEVRAAFRHRWVIAAVHR